jgi:large subunit ribosomal protein LP0
LKKLNLKPFEYGLKLNAVYDDGAILPESIINFNPDSLLDKIQEGVKNIAGLSLSAGYPIEATVPLIIANGFRNIAALSLESGFKIPEVSALTAVEAPKKEEKKEAPKEAAKDKK